MKEKPPPGYEYIFTKYITLRNGKRIYASQRGLKAFRIKVRKDRVKKRS